MDIRSQSTHFLILHIGRLKSLLLGGNILTAIFYAFIVGMLLLLVFSRPISIPRESLPDNDPKTVEPQPITGLTSSLLPANFVISASPSNTPIPSANQAGHAPFMVNKKGPIDRKVNKQSPEAIFENTTITGRDLIREMYAQLLADQISRYHYRYNELPLLYANKSGIELAQKPSDIIYLYNGSKNKEQALSITSGPTSTGFIFTIGACVDVHSRANEIIFEYSSRSINLCKESGDSKAFLIL